MRECTTIATEHQFPTVCRLKVAFKVLIFLVLEASLKKGIKASFLEKLASRIETSGGKRFREFRSFANGTLKRGEEKREIWPMHRGSWRRIEITRACISNCTPKR